MRARRAGFVAVLVIAILVVVTVLWLADRLATDPGLAFLWPWPPAAWIVAPAPTLLYAHATTPIDAVFSRRFRVTAVPRSAALRVRGFRRFEVRVNGALVLATGDGGDWKSAHEVDVAPQLHAGANDLSVRVVNDRGPPALWLALELPGETLVSDEIWRVSRAGGTEVVAAPADAAPMVAAFDEFGAGRDLRAGLCAAWPWLVVALLAGLVTSALLHRRALRAADPADPAGHPTWTPRRADVAFAIIAAAWFGLMIASARWLPLDMGFDASDHLAYIEHIRSTGELPALDASWQAYQPPLYYALVAGALAATGATVADPLAPWIIRGINLLLLLVCLLFVRRSLRLLFPDQPRREVLGILLAGFLPVHLYVFQFAGNEVLAIALGAVSFNACLLLLRGSERTFRQALLLGLVLGAALLAKLSAAMLLPPMLALIAWRAAHRSRHGLRHALGLIAIVGCTALAVSAWHYSRIAARTGDPFSGNWDPALGVSWWQDPGYRTPEDLLRLRPALTRPEFAPTQGLVAGLYASLWADAFEGGKTELDAAPPWQPDLLVIGPLAGTLLTLAIVIGWLVASAAALRGGDPAMALAPALVLTAAAAALWMGLRVPHVSIAKASYVMVALTTPFAVLGALGLDRLAGRARWRSALVLALVLAWSGVSYATYLVRGSAPATLALHGRSLLAAGDTGGGLAALRAALAKDPRRWAARGLLAKTMYATPAQAAELEGELRRSGAIDEAPPAALLIAANARIAAGDDAAARVYLERAAASPAFVAPRVELALLEARSGRLDAAVRWARDALRLADELKIVHRLLAKIFQREGKLLRAHYQAEYAARLASR